MTPLFECGKLIYQSEALLNVDYFKQAESQD